MLDAQFDMLRKIAIEDKTRRDKENPVKSCSSVIPDVISIHTQKYVLNKMHITVSVDMEWHHFNLIDHDSSMLGEKRIVLAARITADPQNEKLEEIMIKHFRANQVSFDDVFINGAWYSTNPQYSYSKILASRYMQKPKSEESKKNI